MIIVELQGGLGNQMFQYACGKALSLKHDQELLIDCSFLNKNQAETDGFTPRKYELDVFGLDEKFADESLIKSFTGNTFFNKALKISGLPYKKVYTEKTGKSINQLNNINPPVLLKGYWQSEQYFAGYTNEIRSAFTFNNDHTSGLKANLTKIGQTNSVSIHFRRGDYVTNPVAQKVLGVLDIDYYRKAIEKIKSEVDIPFFFIFSDDMQWVKNNLPITENYLLVKEDKHWHDMLLMSRCKHHIIANSSFSWWGAWLNPNPDKIILAPRRWFADTELNKTSGNMIPDSWIKL